jgi:predicted Zn-dependent peptidase
MADLDAASLEDARNFYSTWYGPDNAVLSIVGDVDTAATLDAVQRYFGGIPAKGAYPKEPSWDIPPYMGGEIRREVPDRVPVPRLFIGYRCPPFGSAEFDAMEVATTILGGGRGSRLYKALVLDRGLMQPDDSIINSWPFIAGASLTIADLPAREGVDVTELEAAYDEEIARVADGFRADELERARSLLTSNWLQHLATVDGRADLFSQLTLQFDAPELVNDLLPRLLEVSAARAAEVAADVLRRDNRLVLTYLPMSGEVAA